MTGALAGADGKLRCPWALSTPEYVDYHDAEWGRPLTSDQAMFERLSLEAFQSGLSWLVILRKRDGFRKAFDGFDPAKIARYNAKKVERLMADAWIVRNRAKIEGAVASARAYLEIEAEQGFSKYLWDFVDGRTIRNNFRHVGEVPAETELSRQISKDLKARGFKFCGPTIVYAFMQAIGMVDDHLVDCWRHGIGDRKRKT